MKIHTLALASVAIGTLAISFAANAASSPDDIRKAIRDAGGPAKVVSASANATAKMSPRMLDAETEITGAVATDLTVANYLRLVNHNKEDIKNMAALREEATSSNVSAVCTAPMAGMLINEYGVEVQYLYYSKSKEYLFTVAVNKALCAQREK